MSITTLDFPDNETTTFWVGTEEGNIYQANRYDRAGAKAGLNQYDVYRGHSGPVMGLHFHPTIGPVDFSDLLMALGLALRHDFIPILRLNRSRLPPNSSQRPAG